MKNLNALMLITLVTVLTVVVIVGCKKETGIVDTPENERTFKYQRSVKITDESNNYFVQAVISSDNPDEIQNFISLEPKIRVTKYNKNEIEADIKDQDYLHSDVNEENLITPDDIMIEMTENHNIPAGYSAELFFSSGANNNQTSPRASFKNWYYVNSSAKGVKTSVWGNYRMTFYYYSKGCCWYNSTIWVDRGHITHYGPNYSYTFYSTNYTSYLGVKTKVYTSQEAIQTVTYTPYY